MKATIRHYLELAAQWLIGWLMEQFLADPIAHLEDALKQLAEVKGGGALGENAVVDRPVGGFEDGGDNPSLTLPASREGTVGGARSVTRRSPDEVAGERLALGIVFVLASIVFLAGFVVGRVL